MVVRDAECQGYPFIEAACAALPVCDELVLCDGHSTDRTWEGLCALRDAYPAQIRLFRDEWPGGFNRGGVLHTVTNLARRRCVGDYCFSVQANEILHEDSRAAVTALPTARPDIEVFSLRYRGLVGPHLVWTETWRRRLFRNIPDIVAVGDAFEVAHVLPRNCPTLRHELPEPVYRYRTLFPVNFAAKLRSMRPRGRIFDTELALVEQALRDAEPRPDRVPWFWLRVRQILEVDLWENVNEDEPIPYPRRCRGTTESSPVTVKHLLGAWSYSLDSSLTALAAGLD